MVYQKAFLIILDGWGIGPDPKVSAIDQAHTPTMDFLLENYPNAVLTTHGSKVGLPEGQMGNSEVGHINIGAGRIVYQELMRINNALQDGSLEDNEAILNLLKYLKENPDKKLHLLGLVSDGGVHSHMNHLLQLCKFFNEKQVENTIVHAFTDGRDCDPKSGEKFLSTFVEQSKNLNFRIGSVIGRYYAMDRDRRWERTKLAYDLLVNGKGERTNDLISTIQSRYKNGETDEFLKPIVIGSQKNTIDPGDAVFFFNFRTDRPRQLTEMLTQRDVEEVNSKKMPLHFVSMTQYDNSFKGIDIVFKKNEVERSLGEYLAELGISQTRIAETEKYPHVTYFFSGGREAPFPKEERILVNSPKVATYDLQPEMSAFKVKEKLIEQIEKKEPGFICLNFANADMVGHTGVFEAGVRAVQTVDKCLEVLLNLAAKYRYECLIIADHGNADCMINPDGSPNTAHSLNPVPIIYYGAEVQNFKLKDGILADIAPTILALMGLNKPKEMTGQSLIANHRVKL